MVEDVPIEVAAKDPPLALVVIILGAPISSALGAPVLVDP